MVAAHITCPRCGLTLTVSEHAPPRVSCPRCLAALVNPASPLSGVRPMPVIPLDRQVERDTRLSTFLTYGLLVVLAIAAAVTMVGGAPRAGLFVALLLGGLAALVYFLRAARARPRPPAAKDAPDLGALPPPLPGPDGTAVIEYGVPRPAATAGAVAGGFFAAIGVCAAGFFTLAATADLGGSRRSGANYNALFLAAVVLSVIAFIVITVRTSGRWRGFGPGAAAGLCLGMLALGPCAACYLLTLGG